MRTETKQWKLVVERVSSLLTELDPYRLEPGQPDGDPSDEYDMEAYELARKVIRRGSISTGDVDSTWIYWFGESLTAVVGDKEVAVLVARLDELVAVGTAK